MVVLNRIYTKTGDDGTTALGSGERRPKYDLRISAYGTVDETNAAIGVVRLHLAEARELDAMLGRVQNDLFDLGADPAVPPPPHTCISPAPYAAGRNGSWWNSPPTLKSRSARPPFGT